MIERLSARVGFSRQTLDETMKAQEKVRFIASPHTPSIDARVPRRNPPTDERVVVRARTQSRRGILVVRGASAGFHSILFFATALFSPFVTRG